MSMMGNARLSRRHPGLTATAEVSLSHGGKQIALRSVPELHSTPAEEKKHVLGWIRSDVSYPGTRTGSFTMV
eukprot:3426139-Rhodomonas_salina.1